MGRWTASSFRTRRSALHHTHAVSRGPGHTDDLSRIASSQRPNPAAAGQARGRRQQGRCRIRQILRRHHSHMLPKLQLPQAEVATYGALYQTMRSWVGSGASMPFDWHALASITPSGPPPTSIGKLLLGAAWDKWYPSGSPADIDVVPRQLALLLFHGLSGIKLEYDTQDIQAEVSNRAEAGFTAVRECAKRLRVS